MTAMKDEDEMTKKATPLPLRNDTILGVCEGLGEDLKVNANIIRVALILMCFFAPAEALGLYLGLGLVLAAVRFFVPVPNAQAEAPASKAAVNADEELKLAA